MSTPPGPEQPQPQPGQDPYGAPQPPPYQQPSYQQPYYQQPPYGGPPQPGYAFRPAAPNYPSATAAMIFGIVALAGILFCAGATLVLSPVAWIVGGRAVRQIDAAPPGTYGGRDQANAGRVLGIIGTVLLVLGIIAIVAVVALAFATSDDITPEHCVQHGNQITCTGGGTVHGSNA